MSRKAVLKMAGYEVQDNDVDVLAGKPKWFWFIRDTYEESCCYLKSEALAWESAWRHFNKQHTKTK